MSGNLLPAIAPPIVSGLPNWFGKTAKTAESGFDSATILFWGDSTTATGLNFFGGCPLPVTYPTYAAARFVNFHQKPGEALAGTRILNFGNTGASLAAAMTEPSAAAFNITRVLSASQQIYWPAGAAPVAGDTVTIGGVAFAFVSSGATGNQVNIDGTSFGNTISNLVAVLNASTDPVVSRNKYASRSSAYDTSFALDIWSKSMGAAGVGMSVACSSPGALVNGLPSLQLPDLIVFCWGINDVRTGATTQAQLVARIKQVVNRIRAVLPTTDIVLWGPNSFLADDPTNASLVSPATAAAAQSYSSLLYGTYEQLKNVWPNVVVLQKQDIFGKTCQTFAALGGTGVSSMSDQLHPSNGAQTQMADWLAPLIGFKKPFNQQRANLARVSAPTTPYAVYPREVEDPAFYDVVAQAPWLGQGNVSGNDYMDFLFPGARYKEILPGDIVQMGTGGTVFQVPLSGVTIYNLNTTTTRFGFTGTGLLPAFSGGTVTVYRQKFEWDATIQSYRQQLNAYPYARRFFCPAAGSTYLRLYPLAQNGRDPANALINPNTDVIVGAGGFGAITGFTTLNFTGTANWQINKPGTDFTALKNTYLWLFSTTPAREQVENVFEPIRLNAVGSVANSAYVRSIACRGAGKVNRYAYSQKTTGTTDMTITFSVAGTVVLTFTIRANQVGVYSVSPSSFSFPVFPGQVLEWAISGGTGAADVALALDIGG